MEAVITGLLLRKMSQEEENVVAKSFVTEVWDIIPYPDAAVSLERPFSDSKACESLESWFGAIYSPEFAYDHIWVAFRDLMREDFGCDPVDYSTLGYFSAALFEEELKGVFWLRGYLWAQVKKCEPKIIIGRPSYPFKFDEEDIVVLDRNGSYTSVYVTFPGIPLGKPTAKRPDNPSHYYLKIHVRWWRCRHSSDPYPLLTKPGLMWVDKTIFELIDAHYDWEYEVEGGWYWKKVENTIAEKAHRLWCLRVEHPELSLILKTVLNAFYGKSIQNDTKGKKNKKGNFLPEISTHWGQPQFGVNVKSWSRKVMQEIIYQAVDLEVEVFYSNTDSLFIRKRDFVKLISAGVVEVGPELGQFKVERVVEKFICLCPKMYWMRLTDGTEKRSFGCDGGEEWWEEQYMRMRESQSQSQS
jgi:hypothetical protein